LRIASNPPFGPPDVAGAAVVGACGVEAAVVDVAVVVVEALAVVVEARVVVVRSGFVTDVMASVAHVVMAFRVVTGSQVVVVTDGGAAAVVVTPAAEVGVAGSGDDEGDGDEEGATEELTGTTVEEPPASLRADRSTTGAGSLSVSSAPEVGGTGVPVLPGADVDVAASGVGAAEVDVAASGVGAAEVDEDAWSTAVGSGSVVADEVSMEPPSSRPIRRVSSVDRSSAASPSPSSPLAGVSRSGSSPTASMDDERVA
jgi:hypothetical protein